MKKVCFISPYIYPLLSPSTGFRIGGGAEVQFLTLGLALADRDYDVHYIVDDYGQPEVERFGNITVHKVPFKFMGGPNYYLPYSWIMLWKTLCGIRADLHLIKVPRDLLPPLGVFCRIYRKKLIFVGQIDADVDPEFLKKSSHIFSYWFFRLGLKLVDYAVAQNEIQKKGFVEIYKKRTRIIKNIITLPMTDKIRKEKYVLWVGNNLPKKQPEKFLELAQSLPEYRFKMIMALTEQNSADNLLKARLSDIPNLDYLGFVPFSKIGDYYQKASLFVSTSLREGFPNTFLQAWQYETPCVSLHVDPDGIIERLNIGRVSRTFEKLLRDIRELMEEETKRNEIGQNARKYVVENHSPEVIIRDYVALFNEL